MDKLNLTQVGGTHYQGYDYQPIELIEDLKLNFTEGCILKYAIRFRDKGGKDDLLKALDYVKRELIKYLDTPEEERKVKKVDPEAIANIVFFAIQDRVKDEDKDFIINVAKYLHAGMMTKVGEVIMDKIKELYLNEDGMPKETLPSAPVEQLKQIKEAAEHVLKEVEEREESPKDNFIDQVRAEHEGYMDMKLMLQIIRDTITL
jgi:hypothetical protein